MHVAILKSLRCKICQWRFVACRVRTFSFICEEFHSHLGFIFEEKTPLGGLDRAA